MLVHRRLSSPAKTRSRVSEILNLQAMDLH
jgi:hypothetical protein